MEIILNEDNTDLEKELRESKATLDDGIDISKFLREDLSINLELLEIAISLIINNLSDIYIYGLGDYFKFRNIEDKDDKKMEEIVFISNYITKVSNELSETGKKKIFFISWAEEKFV